MGPIKALKKRKRSAEKKADPNVLLAASASAASDNNNDDDYDNDNNDSSQPSDWWDGFSRRIYGNNYYALVYIVLKASRYLPNLAFQDSNGLYIYFSLIRRFIYRFRSVLIEEV